MGIAQAVGAYATWKTYSAYKALRDESDPLTVEQVKGYLEELKKAKPDESVHVIEFEVNAEGDMTPEMAFTHQSRRTDCSGLSVCGRLHSDMYDRVSRW